MLAALPPDIDTSSGGFVWDFTRPTALEVSKFAQMTLNHALQMILPQFSMDEWLDYHAQTRNLTRKAATKATGAITMTGRPGTAIPAGSLVSTASIGEQPSVDFETVEESVIPEEGCITIPIRCTEPGTTGNVAASTILLKGSALPGVTTVKNDTPCGGGTESEDDASLRARILEYDKSQGESFIGNTADYRRWALSVPGVGGAVVLSAADGSGLVTIVLTDSNGEPAPESLCEAVHRYIMRPDAPLERLAPVNAKLLVKPPDKILLTITATVELKPGATLESAEDDFFCRLLQYLPLAAEEHEVKHTRIAAILSETGGINDFKNLLVNGGKRNIGVLITQAPVLNGIILTVGEVT